jgi:hypothetical protein
VFGVLGNFVVRKLVVIRVSFSLELSVSFILKKKGHGKTVADIQECGSHHRTGPRLKHFHVEGGST